MATSLYSPQSPLTLPSDSFPASPSLLNTWKAQMTYSYLPIINHLKNNHKASFQFRDPQFNPFEEDFTGYEEHKKFLIENSANPSHMFILKDQIDRSNKAREVLHRSSITKQLITGIFDPVNLIPIPLGGPSIGFFRSALRVSAGVGALSAASEAIRAPLDPTYQEGEASFNIGMGLAAGFVLGGALSFVKYTPKERKAIEDLKRDAETQMADKGILSKPEYDSRLPREERMFADMKDEIVFDTLNKEQAQLKKQIGYLDNAKTKLENERSIFNNIPELKPLEQEINLKAQMIQQIEDVINDLLPSKRVVKADLENNINLILSNTKISKLKNEINPELFNALKELQIEGIAHGKLSRGMTSSGLSRSKIIKFNRDISILEKQFNKTKQDFKNLEMLKISKDVYSNAVKSQKKVKIADTELKNLSKEVDINELKNRVGVFKTKSAGGMSKQDFETLNMFFKLIEREKFKLKELRKNVSKRHGSNISRLEEEVRKFERQLDNKQDIVNTVKHEKDLRLMEASEFGIQIKQDENWWNDSAFNRAVSTPLKRIVNSKLPNIFKVNVMNLAADGGMILNTHKLGFSMGQSVHMSLPFYKGEVHKAIKGLRELWAEEGKKSATTLLQYDFSNAVAKNNNRLAYLPNKFLGTKFKKDITFEEFTTRINEYRIKNIKPKTDVEARAVKIIDEFYDKWEVRLKETGMIGSQKYFEGLQVVRANQLKEFQEKLSKLREKQNAQLKDRESIERDLRNEQRKFNILEKKYKGSGRIQGLNQEQFERMLSHKSEIKKIKEMLQDRSKMLPSFDLASADYKYLKLLTEDIIPKIQKEFRHIEKQLKSFESTKILPTNEAKMHPRYWNKTSIKKNMVKFKNILKEYYSKPNNRLVVDRKLDGSYTEKTLSPNEIDKWVDDLVDDLMTQEDILDPSNAYYGMGRSKHLQHRRIDIPNELVYDFIQQNPIQVMAAYIARTAPAYEFNIKFGGRTFDTLLGEMEEASILAGRSTDEIRQGRRDFTALYDQIVGAMSKEPSRISFKVANFLRTVAQLNYLGSAGLSAISEPFKIIFENGAGNTFRGLLTGLDAIIKRKDISKKAAGETMLSGEALEPVFGSVQMRLVDELTLNPFNDDVWDRVGGKLKDSFYILNGLGPITNAFKQWTGITNQHTLIETMLKVSKGKADADELTYLARYGLEKGDANKISELINDGVIQKNDRGMYYANTEEWTDPVITKRFRVALANNVMTTIMMGTPADKPILVSGVAYLPEKFRMFFPKKSIMDDPRVPGYIRIENGFLGLPFQFYSYSLAAVSKVNSAAASGQAKSKAAAVVTAMSLAYLGQKIRTPDYIWDEMNPQDKMMRAFDYSGLASLYSGLFYESMHTSLAVGGPDITGGFLQPKFNTKNKGLESVVGLSGAGPSYFYDFASNSFELAFDHKLDYSDGVAEFINGDRGNAAKGLIRQLPFARIPWWKQQVYEFTNAIDRNVD